MQPNELQKQSASNLPCKSHLFQEKICPKITEIEDLEEVIEEEYSRPSFFIQKEINGSVRKEFIWNFD